MSGQMPKGEPIAEICPYLRNNQPASGSFDILASSSPTSSLDVERHCVASATHFTPSAVHQSSCCMNAASYVQCPYYLKVHGGVHRELVVEERQSSRTARVWQQVRRLLPFGRSDSKRRRRVYFFI